MTSFKPTTHPEFDSKVRKDLDVVLARGNPFPRLLQLDTDVAGAIADIAALEASVDAMFADSRMVGARRVAPASVAVSGGAAVIDSNGDIRVTTNGPTAISLNNLFQPGRSYEFDIYSLFSAASNVAFRTRLANADNTTVDYIFQGVWTSNTWPGSSTSAGYGSVSSQALLGVNGGTFGYCNLRMVAGSATAYPSVWRSAGFSRTGASGATYHGNGDSASSSTRTGITFLGGTFQVGTYIRVWEME